MKRKVIRQGHNTLTITLPSKWVNKQNITPGDELDITEKDTSLVVNGESKARLRKMMIDGRGLSIQVLWRSIISAYRNGYDEIKVVYDTPKKKGVYTGFGYQTLEYLFPSNMLHLTPIEACQALVNRLVGVEIIDQKESHCIIKEMGETKYKEFENSLRRMFLLLLGMIDEITESYRKNDKEPLKTIHLTDTNLDRFEDFCLRVLNKKGYAKYNKTSVMFSIIFLLEMVGDEYKMIALKLLEMDGQSNPHLLKQLEFFKDQNRRFYSLFYSYAKSKVEEIYKQEELGRNMMNKHYDGFTNGDMKIIHHLKKVESYIRSLTELRIDLEM